ncbi:type IVB secretion system protein IcmH/DotU [Parendozoicomonas sp. Alg238-R29]|uniref:type IVB secretion system protein IcmH/DotU n=1 Tax=Parendozoicomonas sp. Alg238-R29 TaxID=2993446 RepID=UPI00248F16E4|nr:type IVB secretion system protein IcmH/DotU [Parendozoicomonas sp. Alg238-R29]
MTGDDDTLVVEGRGEQTRIVDDVPPEDRTFTLDNPDGSTRCNILMRLGADLLALIALIPRMGRPMDVNRMREQIQEQLIRIRTEGAFMACHPWALDKCGLIFCAAMDEAVLRTEWGRLSGWANDTLLSRIYGRRNGGELFYQLLEQARLQPEMMVDLLELQYVLLRLGFTGQFHDKPEQWQSTGYELYRVLQRIAPARALECRQMPSVRERSRLLRFRFGRVTTVVLVLVGIILLVAGGRYGREVSMQKNIMESQSAAGKEL